MRDYSEWLSQEDLYGARFTYDALWMFEQDDRDFVECLRKKTWYESAMMI